jgi:hypothetical protein
MSSEAIYKKQEELKGKRVIKREEIGHVVVLCLTPPTSFK